MKVSSWRFSLLVVQLLKARYHRDRQVSSRFAELNARLKYSLTAAASGTAAQLAGGANLLLISISTYFSQSETFW